jgi:hypothetical protein
MNVALAGLPAREEAALGIFLGRTMTGWRCQGTPVRKGGKLPPADLYVLDLAGVGLARWSEAAEAELLDLLGDGAAVLLTPAFDRSWAEMDMRRAGGRTLVLLSKPCGTEAMRQALEKLAARQPALVPEAPAAVVAPQATRPPGPAGAAPAVFVSSAIGTVAISRPVAAVAAVSTDDDANEMTVAELQARLDALPQSGGHVLLRKLAQALALGQAFEVRFTVQNSLIVDPQEGWAASNTPVAVMERVCRSDALASVVAVRALEEEVAIERAQRLGMPVRSLDALLWQLAHATLDAKA